MIKLIFTCISKRSMCPSYEVFKDEHFVVWNYSIFFPVFKNAMMIFIYVICWFYYLQYAKNMGLLYFVLSCKLKNGQITIANINIAFSRNENKSKSNHEYRGREEMLDSTKIIREKLLPVFGRVRTSDLARVKRTTLWNLLLWILAIFEVRSMNCTPWPEISFYTIKRGCFVHNIECP